MRKLKKLPTALDKIMLHDDFIRYMENRGSYSQNPWKNELENDPDLKIEFENAVHLYKILTSHKKNKYPEDYKNIQANRLLSRINADARSERFLLRKKFVRITQIAAAIVILLTVAAIFLSRNDVILTKEVKELQVLVPSGEKSQLILPDGSEVWLNSESKLVYPADFSQRERKVKLEGEAYFDVAKAKNSQFIVYTQDFKVRVLGTKFNVKSYPDDPTIETTVVEGMVKVESGEPKSNFSPVILKPTERLVYKKDSRLIKKETYSDTEQVNEEEKLLSVSNREIIINHVNTSNITSWKDHLLVFDNETFEEIALKLSRWYKVQINLNDEELKSQRYTGKFVHNESLTQVLEAIRLTTPIKYMINQNSVEIFLISNK